MELVKLCFIFILFGASFAATNQMRRLIRTLADSYDILSPPQLEDDAPTNVSHSFQLKRIVSLQDQVLTLDTYLSLIWRDDQLVWDPEDFGGIKMIRLPSQMIWKPDIMLENNAEDFSGIHRGDINVVVLYDGTIFYVLPVKTKSYCNVDHSKLRRKSRVHCMLKFMSWTHDGLSIDLHNEHVSLADYDLDFNKEWKLVDHGVERHVQRYQCCEEPYIDLMYDFELEKL